MSRVRKYRSSRRATAPVVNSNVGEDNMATYENAEMSQELAQEYTGWLIASMGYVAKAAGAAWDYVVSSWQESLFFCAIGGGALATYFVLTGMVAPILIVIQAIVSTVEIFLYSNMLTYAVVFGWYMLPERVRDAISAGTDWVASATKTVFMAPINGFKWAWNKVSSWFAPTDEARDEKALDAAATLRAVS